MTTPSAPLLLLVPLTMAAAQGSPDSGVVYGSDSLRRGVIEPPELVSSPRLHYPDHLRRRGIEGTVIFSFTLDTMGRVEIKSVRALSGSNSEFIDAAMEFLIHCRYRPARLKSPPAPAATAVRVNLKQPVNFRIRKRRS